MSYLSTDTLKVLELALAVSCWHFYDYLAYTLLRVEIVYCIIHAIQSYEGSLLCAISCVHNTLQITFTVQCEQLRGSRLKQNGLHSRLSQGRY